MKSIFKIFALLLVIVMAIGVLSSCAGGTKKADDAEGEWENISWSYKKETGTLTISGGGAVPSAKSSLEVPWYSVRSSVTKLKFTSTSEAPFTSIGDYAFYGMSQLTTVELPEGVTSIGKCAFAYSPLVNELRLPSTLTTIGEGAFEGCRSLLAVEVPASVTTVGERAFAFCRELDIVTFRGKVSQIGRWTFKECIDLESVRMDSAGVTFAEGAFEGAGMSASDIKSLNTSIVSVVCKDADGNEIFHDPSAKMLENGETYTVNAPAVEGYTVGEEKTKDVVGNGEAIVVEFTYTKNAVEEATDGEQAEPEATGDAAVEEEKDDGIKLTTVITIIIFVVVIVGIAVGAFLLFRADKKTTKDSRTVRKNADSKDAKGAKGDKYNKNGKNKKK